ncbi:MAG TPA: DUF2911 domain-containing protein [Planktothrix sp.]|jgi:hypothetical protein
MNCKTVPILSAILGSLVINSVAIAAPKVEFPAPSPSCTEKQRVGLTDIEVDYSRPSVKGRQIFGGLVPFDKVWRTGANQATKITFSTPVKLNGTDIAAGTYGLFTIPGKDEWTIVINKGSDQWGAYKYDEKDDVARFKVTPVELSKPIETLLIGFNKITDDSSDLFIAWDHTAVPIKLHVDIVDKIVSQIEAEMASDDPKKPYFQSAAFYYNHGQDLQKALKWVNMAIAEHEAHYIVFVKAEILAKLGNKTEAIAAAKRSKELAEQAKDWGYVKQNDDLIASLQ